uniref:Peptidase S74 domain-containing protein n=1 Tax=viral metagenome TaxID=1070528 RepID=A0A6C0JC29_9ZZZZ
MTSFKSWTQNNSLFKISGGIVSSKQSKPVDIRNYIRANMFYTRSDIRLKSNICDLNNDDLDKLNKVVPKSYYFRNDNTKHFGFIAQDIEKIFPYLVSIDGDGMKSVNYLEMIPLLLHKINDLERKLEEIKK